MEIRQGLVRVDTIYDDNVSRGRGEGGVSGGRESDVVTVTNLHGYESEGHCCHDGEGQGGEDTSKHLVMIGVKG